MTTSRRFGSVGWKVAECWRWLGSWLQWFGLLVFLISRDFHILSTACEKSTRFKAITSFFALYFWCNGSLSSENFLAKFSAWLFDFVWDRMNREFKSISTRRYASGLWLIWNPFKWFSVPSSKHFYPFNTKNLTWLKDPSRRCSPARLYFFCDQCLKQLVLSLCRQPCHSTSFRSSLDLISFAE